MIKFGIVTPAYNCEEWICQNIQTVKYQSNQDYIHLILDDASTDDTNKIVEKNRHSKLLLELNDDRRGPAFNHWKALQILKDKVEIIVHLDGDDWFLHSNSLAIVNHAYSSADLMATYGNYLPTDPTFPNICIEPKSSIVRENIRLGWPFSHLRTFKSKLIPFLSVEDFKDSNNNWFSSAADVAVFSPILELAGLDRVAKISIPLVSYNRFTNENEDKTNIQDQIRCASEIMAKVPYSRI